MTERDTEQALELLFADIDDADSLEEIQSHVLFANELFENEIDLQFSDIEEEDRGRMVSNLEKWISKIQSKLETLTSDRGASSYTISVSGSMTGPSVSVSVTYSSSHSDQSQ